MNRSYDTARLHLVAPLLVILSLHKQKGISASVFGMFHFLFYLGTREVQNVRIT